MKQLELGDKVFWFDMAATNPTIQQGILNTKELSREGYLQYKVLTKLSKTMILGVPSNVDTSFEEINKKLNAFLEYKKKTEELTDAFLPPAIFDMEKLTSHLPESNVQNEGIEKCLKQ